MTFPSVTVEQWQALVAKDGGRALTNDTFEGLALAALYTKAPASPRPSAPEKPFELCIRSGPSLAAAELREDLEGGADALWLPLTHAAGSSELRPATWVFGVEDLAERSVVDAIEPMRGGGARVIVDRDPIARASRLGSVATVSAELERLARDAVAFEALNVKDGGDRVTACVVSSVPHHDAGADPADELAIVLATGVRYLDALLEAGLSIDRAARHIALRVAVGRDTFTELCKVRSLRLCWQKVLAAAGAARSPTIVHAVCSSRTLTVRDPWVNMLRATTQVFAAILGGADLVTPTTFDEAFDGAPSAHGRRVARNTALVLRDESFLGHVTDAVGGAYAFETVTDAIARDAWERFRAIERAGGIVAELESGRLRERLAASRKKELDAIARRKQPILGVSEFANLDEVLPQPAPRDGAGPEAPRDADAFERLRARAAAATRPPEVLLVTLGGFADSRPRVGFASSFFAAGGLRSHEGSDASAPVADIACLCGTDAVYAEQAADTARALKAAGCRRVLVAGRPGPLEAPLRAAGVDGFIFLGCDAITVLSELLGGST